MYICKKCNIPQGNTHWIIKTIIISSSTIVGFFLISDKISDYIFYLIFSIIAFSILVSHIKKPISCIKCDSNSEIFETTMTKDQDLKYKEKLILKLKQHKNLLLFYVVLLIIFTPIIILTSSFYKYLPEFLFVMQIYIV